MIDIRPTAFMSYATRDDHNGKLTTLRSVLEIAIRDYTADDDFVIFQDKVYVRWGEKWEEKLLDSLDDAVFLIPIITPRFFTSDWCSLELKHFIERQEKLKQQHPGAPPGIICPVSYTDYKPLNNSNHPDRDELVEAGHENQYVDWRRLRHEAFAHKRVKHTIDAMACRIRDALDEIRRG
jgi:hypothetical protein